MAVPTAVTGGREGSLSPGARGRPPGTKQGHLGFASTRAFRTFVATTPSSRPGKEEGPKKKKKREKKNREKKKETFSSSANLAPSFSIPVRTLRGSARARGGGGAAAGGAPRSGRWGAPRPVPVPAAPSRGPGRVGSAQRAVTQRTAPSGDAAGATVCNYPAKYRGELLSERGSGSSCGRTRYAPGTCPAPPRRIPLPPTLSRPDRLQPTPSKIHFSYKS